ncbi:MAG: serine--tRNA ligase, partial [Pseudomonadota bacterium]
MFDLTYIRDHPDAFDAGLRRRGLEPHAASILALDKEARALTQEMNALQAQRNAASKQIGAAKAKGDEETFKKLMAEVDAAKSAMQDGEHREKEKRADLRAALSGLPNLPFDDVPDGADEDDNVELRRVGVPGEKPGAKEHFDLGEALGQMDFETAAKLAGARFALLKGDLARLERAIATFMLDVQTGEFGYEEISPPALVRDEIMFGTGQLPKFAEDSFQTTDGRWLIPTAEVSLTLVSET